MLTLIRWHSNAVLSGLIVGKTQLLRVSLTIYKRVLAILGEATTEPLWPHAAVLWPGCPVSWPMITSLCLLPTPWLDGLRYLPHGLLTQEIIEIAEEGINSLMLLKRVRSARERERAVNQWDQNNVPETQSILIEVSLALSTALLHIIIIQHSHVLQDTIHVIISGHLWCPG